MQKSNITAKFLLGAFIFSVWVAVFVTIFRAVDRNTVLPLERWYATLGGTLLMLIGDNKINRRKFFFSAALGTCSAALFSFFRFNLGPVVGYFAVMVILVAIIFSDIIIIRLFPDKLNNIVFIFFSLSSTYADRDILSQTTARLLTLFIGGFVYIGVRGYIRHLLGRIKS